MTTRGLAGAVVAAAITTLLFIAPAASALTKVTVQGTDQGDDHYAGVAKCKDGQRVVSGGFSTTEEAYAAVNKATGKSKWSVRVQDASSLKVFAYCSDKLKVSSETDSVTFPSSEGVQRIATARCKAGQEAVSGGWSFEPSDIGARNQPVFKSRRKGDGKWAVTAFNDLEDEETDEITAVVYCLDGADLKARSTKSHVGADEAGVAVAKCERGEELLGGGFSTSPKSDFDNALGPDFFYYTSARSGSRGWKASAHNFSDVGGVVKTTAICLQ